LENPPVVDGIPENQGSPRNPENLGNHGVKIKG